MLCKIIRVSLFTLPKGGELLLDKFVKRMRVSGLLHECILIIYSRGTTINCNILFRKGLISTPNVRKEINIKPKKIPIRKDV